MTGQIAIEEIERKRQKIDSLSQYIWNHPEAGFKEYKARRRWRICCVRKDFRWKPGQEVFPRP